MMNKYNANLTWEPFLWYEMRIVSELLLQWLTYEEIRYKVLNENLFQYKTLKSIPKRLSCIKRRLAKLDNYLLKKLSQWDNQEVKIISLYAIYNDSLLVYDFINEFIKEKIDLKQLEIRDSDIMSYFNLKSKEHVEMNNWSENTMKKIRQILKNILSWAWIIDRKKIQAVIINFDLKQYILEHWVKNFLFALWL